ncbi:uncharacterized protein EI97DRAFT_229499 [Westerdykella ornata]|uniref:Uncharacterized protein n=1 Tax=Westerdykella ornata TaxID=318751 RepID=A0A6A6J6U0_WESOR|nr:uncharacterized protein EI97DRAFT_229499 [Westerdykella ornata]KAF2272291.1 hypothetical protein EI97DRAFT_229499 [Westerdykella ornata]
MELLQAHIHNHHHRMEGYNRLCAESSPGLSFMFAVGVSSSYSRWPSVRDSWMCRRCSATTTEVVEWWYWWYWPRTWCLVMLDDPFFSSFIIAGPRRPPTVTRSSVEGVVKGKKGLQPAYLYIYLSFYPVAKPLLPPPTTSNLRHRPPIAKTTKLPHQPPTGRPLRFHLELPPSTLGPFLSTATGPLLIRLQS